MNKPYQSDNPNNYSLNPPPRRAFLSTGDSPSRPWWDSVEDCIIFYFRKRDLIYSPAAMRLSDEGGNSNININDITLRDRVVEASRWVKKLRDVQIKRNKQTIAAGIVSYRYLYFIHAGRMQPAAALELLCDLKVLRGDWSVKAFREYYLKSALKELEYEMIRRELINCK